MQHAYLLLVGIRDTIRDAALADPVNADRLERKAKEIEAEAVGILRLLQTARAEFAGEELSLRVCTLLACASEPTFAEALGVPLAVVLAGRQRMLAIASELVAKGLSGA